MRLSPFSKNAIISRAAHFATARSCGLERLEGRSLFSAAIPTALAASDWMPFSAPAAAQTSVHSDLAAHGAAFTDFRDAGAHASGYGFDGGWAPADFADHFHQHDATLAAGDSSGFTPHLRPAFERADAFDAPDTFSALAFSPSFGSGAASSSAVFAHFAPPAPAELIFSSSMTSGGGWSATAQVMVFVQGGYDPSMASPASVNVQPGPPLDAASSASTDAGASWPDSARYIHWPFAGRPMSDADGADASVTYANTAEVSGADIATSGPAHDGSADFPPPDMHGHRALAAHFVRRADFASDQPLNVSDSPASNAAMAGRRPSDQSAAVVSRGDDAVISDGRALPAVEASSGIAPAANFGMGLDRPAQPARLAEVLPSVAWSSSTVHAAAFQIARPMIVAAEGVLTIASRTIAGAGAPDVADILTTDDNIAAVDSVLGQQLGGASRSVVNSAMVLGLSPWYTAPAAVESHSWAWKITAGASLALAVGGYWYCGVIAARRAELDRVGTKRAIKVVVRRARTLAHS